MPKVKGYKIDTGSIKKSVSPVQGGSGKGDMAEFGMSGGSTDCGGYPCDGTAAKVTKKPSDYAEVGTSARTFT